MYSMKRFSHRCSENYLEGWFWIICYKQIWNVLFEMKKGEMSELDFFVALGGDWIAKTIKAARTVFNWIVTGGGAAPQLMGGNFLLPASPARSYQPFLPPRVLIPAFRGLLPCTGSRLTEGTRGILSWFWSINCFKKWKFCRFQIWCSGRLLSQSWRSCLSSEETRNNRTFIA